jgi:NAD+ kinase
MKTVGLIVNLNKKNAKELVGKLETWFQYRGITVKKPCFDPYHNNFSPSRMDSHLEKVDFMLVLGGDGTLLNTARAVAGLEIPLLGINMGHLGFLTEIELADVFKSLEKLISGEFWMEDRMMLKCSVSRNGSITDEFNALNDIVVTKGAFSRMICLEAYVDNHYVDTYYADGLIISSPTGSTAYSLSAGGPIVSPEMELMLVTPICPHTLYSRPLVINPICTVNIMLKSQFEEVMLTVDGQLGFKLIKGDEIIVKRSSWKTKLIRLKGKNFYHILRTKLRESYVRNEV